MALRKNEILDWSELKVAGRPVALLGNGVSIAIDEQFHYQKLLEHPSPRVSGVEWIPFWSLIRRFGPNPERILEVLRTTSDVAATLNLNCCYGVPLVTLAHHIKTVVPERIRSVHPRGTEIQGQLAALGEQLKGFSSVFTTNYDLTAYWAINSFQGDFDDGFRTEGRFKPEEMNEVRTHLWYLHGGFHLRRERWRTSKKTTPPMGNLLDADDIAEAVVVLEGTAEEKLAAINANHYLSTALGQLQGSKEAIVVLGHSLSKPDKHICEAIDRTPKPIYVSVLRDSEGGHDQQVIENASHHLPKHQNIGLQFFWHDTHPLFQALTT
jgi:hypothetical protein